MKSEFERFREELLMAEKFVCHVLPMAAQHRLNPKTLAAVMRVHWRNFLTAELKEADERANAAR